MFCVIKRNHVFPSGIGFKDTNTKEVTKENEDSKFINDKTIIKVVQNSSVMS
ncbi:MAG: hypothetical protein H0X50_07310 [Nitrosopumilus sp.]|nr:hypothetical protein [Nitrosopumilus sp.]